MKLWNKIRIVRPSVSLSGLTIPHTHSMGENPNLPKTDSEVFPKTTIN